MNSHNVNSSERKRWSAWVLAGALALACTFAWPAGARCEPTDGSETIIDPPVSPRPKNYPPDVQKAIDKFETGDAKTALEMLQKAAKDHPELPIFEVMCANLFFSVNQPGPGKSYLEQATAKHPKDPEAHLIFGDIAVREGRFSDADLQYRTGFQLLTDPKNPTKLKGERKTDLTAQYYSGMASVYQARGQWPKAEEALKTLVDLKHKVYTNGGQRRLASVLFNQRWKDGADPEKREFDQKKLDETVAALDKARGLDPSMPPTSVLMAGLYTQSGDKDSAEKTKEWLAKAQKDAPKDIRTHLAMARWTWENDDLASAEKEAAEAEKLLKDPKNEAQKDEVQILMGTIARYKKDYAKAEKCFKAVLENSPDNFLASNQLALVLAEQNDKKKLTDALKRAEMNAKANQTSAEAASTIGWVQFKLGLYEQAEKSLKVALTARNITRDTAYYTARVLHRTGKYTDAEALLKRALESKGPFAHRSEAEKWKAELAAEKGAEKKAEPKDAPKKDGAKATPKKDAESKAAKTDG